MCRCRSYEDEDDFWADVDEDGWDCVVLELAILMIVVWGEMVGQPSGRRRWERWGAVKEFVPKALGLC